MKQLNILKVELKSDMEQQNKQLIMGKNPIIEAINSERPINKIYISEGINSASLKNLFSLLKEKKIVIQYVPRKKLDQMADGANHQGVIAEVAPYDYHELYDLVAKTKATKPLPFFVMLDGIEDPHNLGSILRTADVTGVDGVIIPKRRSVGLTSTVAKTSAGAIEYIPVSRVVNLAQTVDYLKAEGFWIVGTDASANQSYFELDYKIPICLVIGSEGKGISRLIKDKCDFFVKMPMAGHVNSLNASVAAGIIMYEVYKQRSFAK